MTREEFKELDIRDIDEVVRINNEEGCYAFADVYQLNDDCIYELIMDRLKNCGVMNVKWLLEDVHTNNGDAYVCIDGCGWLKDLDEERFYMLKDGLKRELEEKGFFEEEEEDEE